MRNNKTKHWRVTSLLLIPKANALVNVAALASHVPEELLYKRDELTRVATVTGKVDVVIELGNDMYTPVAYVKASSINFLDSTLSIRSLYPFTPTLLQEMLGFS